MIYLLPIPQRPACEHFSFIKQAFTPEECKKIIDLAEAQGWETATTAGGIIDKRRSSVSWIGWDPGLDWLFGKLAAMVMEHNANFFGLDISAFSEKLQITKYEESNEGHYGWHTDAGSGALSVRKLSLVVQLSAPEDYEGGKLEIFMAQEDGHATPPVDQGSVMFFPSYEAHRVTPVTKGTRYSLVGWVSGAPFR